MIASIIVGYKNDDLTISYVKEQLSKINQDNVIVLVNNSATEESNNHLSLELNGEVINDINTCIDKSLRFFVIDSKENLGFARANNLGVRFIQNHFPECEYLLFTNNDIKIVDENVVDVLIHKMETIEGIGMITPNIIGVTGARQTPQPYPNPWKIIAHNWLNLIHIRLKKRNYAEEAKAGFHYTFAECFFISRAKDYAACEGMDPATFLYAEGLCFSERMLKIGLKYYFEPTVTVIHENGTTTSKSFKAAQTLMMIIKANNYYLNRYRHMPTILLALFIIYGKLYQFKIFLKDKL